jgi:hypothetical protein
MRSNDPFKTSSYALRVIIGGESPLFSEQNATADQNFCGVPHNTQSGLETLEHSALETALILAFCPARLKLKNKGVFKPDLV